MIEGEQVELENKEKDGNFFDSFQEDGYFGNETLPDIQGFGDFEPPQLPGYDEKTLKMQKNYTMMFDRGGSSVIDFDPNQQRTKVMSMGRKPSFGDFGNESKENGSNNKLKEVNS